MNVDTGIFGKILGYIVGVIILAAVVTSGIMVLAGRAVAQLPQGLGDFIVGLSGSDCITADTTIWGMNLVDDQGRLLKVFKVELPYCLSTSAAQKALAGETTGGSKQGGIDYGSTEAPPEGEATPEPDGGAGLPGEVPSGDAEKIKACTRAIAQLDANKGSENAVAIIEAANQAIDNCTEAADLSYAQSALAAAEKARIEAEQAAEARLEQIETWQSVMNAGKVNILDTGTARQVIQLGGGNFRLDKIEGLRVGVFKGYTDGTKEVAVLILYPPEAISAEPGVDYITIRTPLKTLFDWGIGRPSQGVLNPGTVPEPGDYTLP